MFRARIYAQGFTLAAMLGGSVYYKKKRDEEKQVDVAKAMVDAKAKQTAWIKELEIRDREDKEVCTHLSIRPFIHLFRQTTADAGQRHDRNKRYAERRREAQARATDEAAGDSS